MSNTERTANHILELDELYNKISNSEFPLYLKLDKEPLSNESKNIIKEIRIQLNLSKKIVSKEDLPNKTTISLPEKSQRPKYLKISQVSLESIILILLMVLPISILLIFLFPHVSIPLMISYVLFAKFINNKEIKYQKVDEEKFKAYNLLKKKKELMLNETYEVLERKNSYNYRLQQIEYRSYIKTENELNHIINTIFTELFKYLENELNHIKSSVSGYQMLIFNYDKLDNFRKRSKHFTHGIEKSLCVIYNKTSFVSCLQNRNSNCFQNVFTSPLFKYQQEFNKLYIYFFKKLNSIDIKGNNISRDFQQNKRTSSIFKRRKSQIVQNINWNELENIKNNIGLAGEEIVLNYERNKLISSGQPLLSNKVEHSSKTRGDGLGYDIKSYDLNGAIVYIEVKTTINSINTPFYFTANELIKMDNIGKQFVLFRIYNLDLEAKKAAFFVVKGSKNVRDSFALFPTSYKVQKSI